MVIFHIKRNDSNTHQQKSQIIQCSFLLYISLAHKELCVAFNEFWILIDPDSRHWLEMPACCAWEMCPHRWWSALIDVGSANRKLDVVLFLAVSLWRFGHSRGQTSNMRSCGISLYYKENFFTALCAHSSPPLIKQFRTGRRNYATAGRCQCS